MIEVLQPSSRMRAKRASIGCVEMDVKLMFSVLVFVLIMCYTFPVVVADVCDDHSVLTVYV